MKKIFYLLAIWGASILAVTFTLLAWSMVPFMYAWMFFDRAHDYWDGVIQQGWREVRK